MAEKSVEYKPEGTMATVVVLDIQNNYHRSDEAFEYLPDKIQALKDVYKADGFQSTFEIIIDKQGRPRLAGGGHHRTKAMKEMIEAGDANLVRGMFKNDDGNWCIKVVKKNYTKEQMLRNFVIENADAWNVDSDQNVYMQTLQIKSVLDTVLQGSKDVEDFIAKLPNSATPILMDARAYTRAKNNGVGAKTIQQYIGAWSHSRIQMAVQLINEPGEAGQKLQELAKSLPSITMAYKFRNLMTEVEDGEKVRSSKDDMTKAEKLIEKEGYNRADLEDIDKFKTEKELSPLEAIEAFTAERKEDRKKPSTPPEPPTKVNVTQPAEDFMEAIKRALNTAKLAKGDVSKAQFLQAKDIFGDLAGVMKQMEARFGGKKK